MTAGAAARPLPGPRQGPCHEHPWGHYQDHASRTSTTVRMQLATRPAGQAPTWRRADLRGDPPLRHLSCLPAYLASQAPLARALEGAATDEIGLSPAPDKARTPKQGALNAPCHVMRGITSHH